MDFTLEENVEDSNQTNKSGKLSYVAGEALALAGLVRNQVYLTTYSSSLISVFS